MKEKMPSPIAPLKKLQPKGLQSTLGLSLLFRILF